MKKIVGIGANVCDTLINVPAFPLEDTKLRANSITVCGGGPCATGLVAASKLGGATAFIGTLTDDSAGKFLAADFERYGVSTEYIQTVAGFTSFNSFVILSEETTSRTCVFHRGDVPEKDLTDEQKSAIINAEILMVDGNNMKTAVEGARLARENGVNVLYDAGGLYEGVEKLLPFANILIPSEEFSLGFTGEKTAYAAAKKLFEMFNPDVVVITQGKRGGICYDGKEAREYPAIPVDKVVDSNGAGDVFHGAYAFALTKGYDYYKACLFSSGVSALKCTKVGARAAVPDFETVTKFLKESGIDEFKEDLD